MALMTTKRDKFIKPALKSSKCCGATVCKSNVALQDQLSRDAQVL